MSSSESTLRCEYRVVSLYYSLLWVQPDTKRAWQHNVTRSTFVNDDAARIELPSNERLNATTSVTLPARKSSRRPKTEVEWNFPCLAVCFHSPIAASEECTLVTPISLQRSHYTADASIARCMELPAIHSEQINRSVKQNIESLQLSKGESSQQSRRAAAPKMISFVAIRVFVSFIVLFGYLCTAQVVDYKGLEPFCLNDTKLTQCIASDEESLKCAAIDPNDQASLANCVCAQSMFNSYIEYVLSYVSPFQVLKPI